MSSCQPIPSALEVHDARHHACRAVWCQCLLEEGIKHCNICSTQTIFEIPPCGSYLLGLLAMIKCSICSYQCDNWYVSNWRLACHLIFQRGGCIQGLPWAPQVLHWHGTLLWATHPLWVTKTQQGSAEWGCIRKACAISWYSRNKGKSQRFREIKSHGSFHTLFIHFC